jgi:DNA adenine methylase
VPTRTLLYLDPPYFVKGSRRLYSNFFVDADHAKLAALVASLDLPWLVSYDDAPAIRRLYKDFRKSRYLLSYTARQRYQGAEIMFFGDTLAVSAASKRLL